MKSHILCILALLLQFRNVLCELDPAEDEEYTDFYSDAYNKYDLMEEADKLFDNTFASKLTDLSDSLTDAMKSTESFDGMVDMLEKITENLPNSDVDGCVYACENNLTPVRRAGYAPAPNGCGASLGLLKIKLNTTGYDGIEKCCNTHDICYSTCNQPREDCDDKFKDCMFDYCKTDPEVKMESEGRSEDICTSAADMIYLGVDTFGCPSYQEAQREACECKKLSKKKAKKDEGKNKKLKTPKSEL